MARHMTYPNPPALNRSNKAKHAMLEAILMLRVPTEGSNPPSRRPLVPIR